MSSFLSILGSSRSRFAASMLTEIATTMAHKHPKDCFCSPCVALRSEVSALSPGRYMALANRIRPRPAAEDDDTG